MRRIDMIIIHCSATPAGRDVRLEDIDRWHRQQGWNGCGYHYVVELDGAIRKGRAETTIGSHCRGYNAHSIGVCYIGGLRPSKSRHFALQQKCLGRLVARDTRTPAQKASLLMLLKDLKHRYPQARILGHHDLNPHKACPCFNAALEYAGL